MGILCDVEAEAVVVMTTVISSTDYKLRHIRFVRIKVPAAMQLCAPDQQFPEHRHR